jgi:hypothetical protein
MGYYSKVKRLGAPLTPPFDALTAKKMNETKKTRPEVSM